MVEKDPALKWFAEQSTKLLRYPLQGWVEKHLNNYVPIVEIDDPEFFEHQRSFILAPNHVKIPESLPAKLSLAPDTWILNHIVEGLTGNKLYGIALSDLDDNPTLQALQPIKHIVEQLHGGALQGLGFYPFKRRDFTSLRQLAPWIEEKVIAGGHPLLIYPTGRMEEDFDENQELEKGASSIAIKYKLPIIPAYIIGCNDWNVPKGTPAYVYLGTAITPYGRSRDEITKHIQSSILALKAKYVAKHQ